MGIGGPEATENLTPRARRLWAGNQTPRAMAIASAGATTERNEAAAQPAATVTSRAAPAGRELWGALGLSLPWLIVLVVGSFAVVVLDFLHPVAYRHATVRVTIETVVTVFALVSIWLLSAQFIRTRAVRDLLLLAA